MLRGHISLYTSIAISAITTHLNRCLILPKELAIRESIFNVPTNISSAAEFSTATKISRHVWRKQSILFNSQISTYLERLGLARVRSNTVGRERVPSALPQYPNPALVNESVGSPLRGWGSASVAGGAIHIIGREPAYLLPILWFDSYLWLLPTSDSPRTLILTQFHLQA